ncbi:MAG TPA: tRNA epoxyqueuosine(34) reductase QueG [Phycisphaerae bacterium]|nr:tRNA epoxyqueuosine(34) reductase QueG [Phycisphaerae bacterium]
MSSHDNLADAVKEMAIQAGFARVGIAPAGPVPHAEAYEAWLSRGYNAGMAYMPANREKRLEPAKLVEGARSVICLAAQYDYIDRPAGSAAFVARYARGTDYHEALKHRCRTLGDDIRRIAPHFEGRAFADSAPVMERSLAALAGVGWIGRNAMLIVPGIGSYVLLCEIICNLPLPADSPIESGCRNCGACLAACPTSAICDDGLVDARRCISYLTVEHRGTIPAEFWPLVGSRVFGCDTCQEACPQNQRAAASPRVAAPACGECRTLAEILAWTRQDWDAATRGSATRRATYEMFLRNACLAAGNSADASLRRPLTALRRRAPELSREIDWALARLVGV